LIISIIACLATVWCNTWSSNHTLYLYSDLVSKLEQHTGTLCDAPSCKKPRLSSLQTNMQNSPSGRSTPTQNLQAEALMKEVCIVLVHRLVFYTAANYCISVRIVHGKLHGQLCTSCFGLLTTTSAKYMFRTGNDAVFYFLLSDSCWGHFLSATKL